MGFDDTGAGAGATFYDPQQPRGDHGRWATTVSGGVGAGPILPPPANSSPAPDSGTDAATATGVPAVLGPMESNAFLGSGVLPDFHRRSYLWANRLSKSDRGAFTAYTNSNYKTINKVLRQQPVLDHPSHGVKTRKWAVRIHDALSKFVPAPTPITSYRGLATSSLTKLRKIEAALTAALKSGSPLSVYGFQSSSLDPAFAAGWTKEGGAVLEIKSRRGVYIGSLSNKAGEYEVLHNHGAAYKVTGVRDAKYQLRSGAIRTLPTYTLEEIEPNRANPDPAQSAQPADARFGWDPAMHPKDALGRFAVAGTGIGAPKVLDPAHPGPDGGTLPRSFMEWGERRTDNFDKRAKSVLKSLAGSGRRALNYTLRTYGLSGGPGASEKALARARVLAAALDKAAPHPTPVLSYRGVSTRRAKSYARLEGAFADALATGKSVALTGFTSASLDPAVAASKTDPGRGFVLELSSRRGLYVGGHGYGTGDTREVLHNHGSRFRVAGVRPVEYRARDGESVTLPTYSLVEVEPDDATGAAGATADRLDRNDWHDICRELAGRPVDPNPQTDAGRVALNRFRADCDAMARYWVSGQGLSARAEAVYGAALTHCFSRMRPKAVQTVLKNLRYGAPTFHRDVHGVGRALATVRRSPHREDRGVGGFWAWASGQTIPGYEGAGTLHLDGGSDTDPDVKPAGRNGPHLTTHLYAHELGHVVDGHQEYSTTPEWEAAWKSEIDRDDTPLSQYARTDAVEGFAEYYRLALTDAVAARQSYPKCHAYFARLGFVDPA